MGLDAELLLHPEGPIARRIPRYELRPQQTAMVRAVDSALSTRRPLLIEAGTGTGKSFGYLLPAVRRVLDNFSLRLRALLRNTALPYRFRHSEPQCAM